jgi:cell division protein ZapA
MAQLTIRINGYAYTVGCEDGQETHLLAMAEQVESRVQNIKALGNQSGEARLLLLAALLMADELHDLRNAQGSAPKPPPARRPSKHFAQTISRLADQAEQIAQGLEQE